LVTYAAENQIGLTARGAGSGLAGESLGSGLIVDMSRYFRGILEIGTDRVRVQPGVVYRELNTILEKEGRRLAPEPASGAQCTIGGMLATNASGSNLLRHGYIRDHVLGLRVILDTADAVNVEKHALRMPPDGPHGHLEDIVAAVGQLLVQNADIIR